MPIDNPISSAIPKKPDGVTPATKTCHCGKEFVPRRAFQKHCCKRCGGLAWAGSEKGKAYYSGERKAYERARNQSEKGQSEKRKLQKYTASKRWRQSEKGRAWYRSKKRRDYERAWRQSEQGKTKQQKYRRTYLEKGGDLKQAAYKRSEKYRAYAIKVQNSQKEVARKKMLQRKKRLRQRLAEATQQLATILGEPIA